jgi:carboxymethylenebutenolidase
MKQESFMATHEHDENLLIEAQREVDSLRPSTMYEGTRRSFMTRTVGSAVGVGFAAAAGPVMAQTVVKTDTQGLKAGEVMLTVAGTKVPVYVAQPEGKTNLPVILVVSEIFGVHEHIADVARRFAKAGYMAMAPELFVRQGDVNKYGNIAELVKEVIAKAPDEQVMTDLDACVAYAKGNGGSDKVGVTGFCWGGRITWLYAAHAKVNAGVAWYGRLVGAPNTLQPKHPVDLVANLSGPVLGLYGGKDDGIPQEGIDKMKVALAAGSAAAKKSVFVVYQDAPHGFHADYRATYRKEYAEDGFKRCLEWFKLNGLA